MKEKTKRTHDESSISQTALHIVVLLECTESFNHLPHAYLNTGDDRQLCFTVIDLQSFITRDYLTVFKYSSLRVTISYSAACKWFCS